jgi:hypothetical protein
MADVVCFCCGGRVGVCDVGFEDLNVCEEIRFWDGVKERAFLTLETCIIDVRLSQH